MENMDMGMSKDEGSPDPVSFCMEFPKLQAYGVLIFSSTFSGTLAVPAIVITLRNMSDAKHHPASITQQKLFSNQMMV